MNVEAGWGFVRTEYAAGAWWQLFTSQSAHFSLTHAALNFVSMVLLLCAFRWLLPALIQGIALLGGVVGVAVVIALDTNCDYYAGASGALHGLLAGNAIGLWLAPVCLPSWSTKLRGLSIGILLGLSLKLWLQHSAAIPTSVEIPTYYPAHEAGALGGAIAVLLFLTLGRTRQRHSTA